MNYRNLIDDLQQSSCHLIDNRGLASADEETKERIAKSGERQEHRIRNDCQKQAAGVERQFLKTECVCQTLAKKEDKS